MNILTLIWLLEGFTTLAVQIIGMRTAVPVVWSSIILTSIYIWIILLALSAGYYVWWIVASRYKKSQLPLVLFFYLLFSWLYYAFITFSVHKYLLERLLANTGSYIWTLFITAIVLFFLPIFIWAQTIPLLTEMSAIQSKGKAAWSMLFWSTVWSFLWSVLTSIFLFQELGVYNSSKIVVIIMVITACISLYLWKKQYWIIALFVAWLLSLGYYFWINQHSTNSFVYDSPYQAIEVRDFSLDGEPGKVFHTNGAYASAIFTKTKESPFGYIREAINLTKEIKPSTILVIWTAWFTFPYEVSQLDFVTQIDTVDIDPSVKRIAEEQFLENKLPDNIDFYPQSARYFLNQAVKEWKTYDMIFVDAFNWKYLPDELVTQEFYSSLTALASPEKIIMNMILDKAWTSHLSKNITTTMKTTFGEVYWKNVSHLPDEPIVNLIITWKQYSNDYKKRIAWGVVYTDDKRSSEVDLVMMQDWVR